ncbi:YjjW family glycine radical enzyme activase [Clostridium niameyense]|uniref:YjjW family glycine radical enzyme activase n=1 Tax=Clostridium niameyense TaxID=1622073 RepID=A0A6M0RBL1_9CLOT|nr:YjjW family glycine radical enzyme activase [Clostridium niameyense]NEZ47644.1 YjjW family glycine radical enzyme activase [Clostridium niameyense]
MIRGLVRKIIPFSSVDGPGNRTAIFFQGCNFNCLYCHNPETINICKACGTCAFVCPYDAVEFLGDRVKWNEDKCMDCGLCIKKCKNNCGPRTKYMSVGEILKEILKSKPFISGITVSGGECTLQNKFLIDLFEKINKLNLSIFVDTNGSLDFSKNEQLTNLIDKAMLDIKSFDNEEHKMLTGRDNTLVLKNAKYLASINKLYEIRTVIVPELLNNERNVNEISRLISSLNPNIRYKIIKYRPMGVRENKIDPSILSPSQDYMENLRNIAIKNGCRDVIIL